jgi:hypothetical protein
MPGNMAYLFQLLTKKFMPRNTQPNENTGSQKKQQDDAANSTANEKVIEAHEQADKDIQHDADLSVHSPNDDLDEGETARLGEDRNDLA